jgi:hypothetical protein
MPPTSDAGTAIQPYVQHIRDALWRTPSRGLASVLVGAGFSRNAEPAIPGARNFPLWDELARSMAAGIGLDKDGKPRDPLQLAQMYAATLGPAELHRLIERQIPDAEHRPGGLHRRLLSLPWADVFTTNYDTLLERSCSEVFDRRYEQILAPTDIPLRRAPRLVKLHGTLGVGGHLIATQEDYRRYPQSHAPFVNMVRQAVMETVVVLIGFTGDDPNFLEWIGWVRDILGKDAPKIYLCGIFDGSPATRALLDSRQVTAIDLAGVASKCTNGHPHAFALDWFLAALESGKPGRALKWAPRESTVISRDPPLPPTKIFTPFSGHPKHNPGVPFDAGQIVPIAAIWREQREQYPGWHLAPDSVRERVWSGLSDWRNVIFFHSDPLSVVDRLSAARELCWRLELCLSPIFTSETDKLAQWLEAINPFGAKLSLADAAPPSLERETDLREAWMALALHVLRTAREDLDEERYAIWRARLLVVAGDDPTIVGELHHEEAQRQINRLDLVGLRAALTTWRVSASQPLELARLAVLWAELGDRRAAAELAMIAVNLARTDKRSHSSVSLEAWCCLLLSVLDWRETAKNAEWRERIEVAKDQGYNPWETIETFRTELKAPRPQRVRLVERTVGFDPGDVRRTIRSGGRDDSSMPAWRLMRLMEKGPCPIGLGILGETAAHAALWIGDGAPFWSLATLLRAGAKPEILHEVFDRAAVAILPAGRVAQLQAQLLRVVDGEMSGLDDTSRDGNEPLGQRMLGTALDLLSRLAFRLAERDLASLLDRTTKWLSSPAIMRHHGTHERIEQLLERAVDALPSTALSRAVELFLSVPMLGEADCEPRFDHHWPEPFDTNALRQRSVAPPAAPPADWARVWSRLIVGLRGGHPRLRERAFVRAYFLYDNDWLTAAEQTAFGEAVWASVDSGIGVPTIRGYRCSMVLHLPLAGEHDAASKVRRRLLDHPLGSWKNESGAIEIGKISSFESWLTDLAHVFRHPALTNSCDHILPLSSPEAEALIGRIFVWWPSAMEVLVNPSGGTRRGESIQTLSSTFSAERLASLCSCLRHGDTLQESGLVSAWMIWLSAAFQLCGPLPAGSSKNLRLWTR